MKTLLLGIIFSITTITMFANAGASLKKSQHRQERIIRSAYKRGAVTAREYDKLMAEQKTIKRYIHLAERDRFWSNPEIARVQGKLDRAEDRLKRYKHNSEVY